MKDFQRKKDASLLFSTNPLKENYLMNLDQFKLNKWKQIYQI